MNRISTLKHPDARERALALRLDSVTPQDVAIAVLDPHPLVWQAAFYHPQSAFALDVLAANSRDSAGNDLGERHRLLLQDPRCHQNHVDSIKRALEQDTYLPITQQSARLKELKGLQKKEEPAPPPIYLDNRIGDTDKYVNVDEEPQLHLHPELSAIYHKGIQTTHPLSKHNSGLGQAGAYSKAVYHIPGENGQMHKFIVKPYFDNDQTYQGWNEGTSQDVYNAANLGHLHQKSFVGEYKNGSQVIPATVIHLEKATPIHAVYGPAIVEDNPKAPEEARKIAIMDFLAGNADRHQNNLMVKDGGQLLAIDHGLSFNYYGDPMHEKLYEPNRGNRGYFGRYTSRAPVVVTPHADSFESGPDTGHLDYHTTVKNWWPTVSEDVRRAFEKRLELIPNLVTRRHLQLGFNARYNWLNKQAQANTEDWLEALKKALYQNPYDDPVIEEPIKSNKYDTVHKELVAANLPQLQPKADTFEQYVNHPTNPVKPERGSLEGIEQKSLVKHADNTYLIKAANTKWNPLSGWGELTSQAMYHAGGLGHLHQNVHATHLNIAGDEDQRQQPAIVIHFKPGSWGKLAGGYNYRNKLSKQGKEDLRKAYLMDFLTGNADRHSENVLVNTKTGEPQMIDHGFAFRRDDWPDPEDQDLDKNDEKFKDTPINKRPLNYDLFAQNNLLNNLGYLPNEETFKWWDQNKEPIRNTFDKYLQMIPNKEERARRKAFFDKRFNDIDSRHPIVEGLAKSEVLEKGAMARLAPFNPRQSPMKALYADTIKDWVTKENKPSREQLGLVGMEPNARQRALQKLHAKTETRRNPVTGEREFLLHRGHGDKESEIANKGDLYDTRGIVGDYKDPYSSKGSQSIGFTSWMPHSNIDNAHAALGNMVSAWVPESKVSFFVPQYNGIRLGNPQLVHNEQEVIVEPGQYKTFHSAPIGKDGHYFSEDWRKDITNRVQALHKSEELEKAIADIPVGKRTHSTSADIRSIGYKPVNTYEYSHLLTPEQRQAGYSLRLSKIVRPGGGETALRANIFYNGKPAGYVFGGMNTQAGLNNSIEPHSNLEPPHRGKGLGVKAYEALYTHAKHKEGIKTVNGGSHTRDAHRVHLSLARRHGLDYDARPTAPMSADPEAWYNKYSYVIKDEIDFNKNEDLLLSKSLGNAEFLHDQHVAFPKQTPVDVSGIHEQLLKVHPSVINPGVRHFEIAINGNKASVAPTKQQHELQGIQPKALYHHNTKGYLVKPANEKSTRLGAWNEMTSQALYHAGGIGHLHQKVHATIGKTGLERNEPAHALAIHIEPNSMTFNDANGWTEYGDNGSETIHPGQDLIRVDRFYRNPESVRNMAKIGMMDYLTGNPDRHGANIILKPDGSPIAIDHSRAFYPMRKHAIGAEEAGEKDDHEPHFLNDPAYGDKWISDYGDHMADSAAAMLGGMPDKETLKWWEDNKAPMLERFKEHLNMLPDPVVRQKMLNVFMVRYNRLGELAKHSGNTEGPVAYDKTYPLQMQEQETLKEGRKIT